MNQTVLKTINIRLDITQKQNEELKLLFSAFQIGINWSLQEIEKRYQKFISEFKPILEKTHGVCAGCNTEKDLQFLHNSHKFCISCATKTYSEYTVRKEVYGARERTVENDMKDIIEIPNKTHYDMLFSQAYAMWKSFNAWRNKRAYEAQQIKKELESMSMELQHAVQEIEQNATSIKKKNKNTTWLKANAEAAKSVYSIHPHIEPDTIRKAHEKFRDFQRLSIPLKLPQLEECRTVMMNAGFVQWNDSELFITLWNKGRQSIGFFGKEFLKQYIPKMEADNKVYCNLSRKNNRYYLNYPLEIKVKQPLDIKECKPFVVMFSPHKVGIFGYDTDGCLNSTQWIGTGELMFAKRHFKDKRIEVSSRKDVKDARRKGLTGEAFENHKEKMRHIRKRKKWITRRGAYEAHFTSTFNHQLSHEIIEKIQEQSENPKILIWDVGNGITQNFGKNLNFLKNLWPAVQQQEYTKHKAAQASIPIIEVKYNKCNDLVCSRCGARQVNGQKPAKVITHLIKDVKNFKCAKCGYEVNMLINQANNIINTNSKL